MKRFATPRGSGVSLLRSSLRASSQWCSLSVALTRHETAYETWWHGSSGWRLQTCLFFGRKFEKKRDAIFRLSMKGVSVTSGGANASRKYFPILTKITLDGR
jgi:hypothetical protein